MPTYTYVCRTCNKTEDQFLPMDSRDKPCEFPCSECGNFTVQRPIQAPHISYSGNLKTTNSFNDRLKDIKKNLPPGPAQDNINNQIK